MGQKAREMDKKILNCFLKQDAIEKSLGYRISGSGQPVNPNSGVRVTDVSNQLPADYRTQIAQDNVARARIATDIAKSVTPAGNTSTRQIYTQEEIRQIDAARQNPDGVIVNSNDEVLKALLEQNKLLTEELRYLRKSMQPRPTGQRIVKAPPKLR